MLFSFSSQITRRTGIRIGVLVGSLVFCLSALAVGDDRSSGAKKKAAPVQVYIDTSQAPETEQWADVARRLVEKWHPIISDMLHTEGFVSASEVNLVFKTDMKIPAATSGDTISISVDHIKKHPEDFGMVIHELAHVLQRYRKFDKETWWLVEGIADYVRYYRFEPKTRLPRINAAKASYRDGYKTSAQFLAWIEKKHDKALISHLNQVLRTGEYTPAVFEKYTGKSLDRLWSDFVKAQARR
jgi:hypothetical protein